MTKLASARHDGIHFERDEEKHREEAEGPPHRLHWGSLSSIRGRPCLAGTPESTQSAASPICRELAASSSWWRSQRYSAGLVLVFMFPEIGAELPLKELTTPTAESP